MALNDYAKKDIKLQESDYVYEDGFIALGWLITGLVIAVLVVGAIMAVIKEGLFGVSSTAYNAWCDISFQCFQINNKVLMSMVFMEKGSEWFQGKGQAYLHR